MADCLFCRIVEGRIPCKKIAESKGFIAFLDIAPHALGHALIVPKDHSSNFQDFSATRGQEFIEFTKRIADAIVAATKTEGFNLLLNNGASAGQVVFHTHFHIIPRKTKDGVTFQSHVTVSDAVNENLLREIHKHLQ